MELYVSQLIEDLQAAHQQEDDENDLKEETIEDMLEESELFVSGKNHIEVYKLIGFIPEQFPPVYQLSLPQIRKILVALTDLLWSYNIDTNFPEKLPTKLKYELLTEEMYKEVFIGKHGITSLDYCDLEIKSCPFGKKYCDCRLVQEEIDNSPPRNNDEIDDEFELPF